MRCDMIDIFDIDSTTRNVYDELKLDIRAGMESTQKSIPPKYLYDMHGSKLFNDITRHPDYYLTNSELNIINTHKQDISNYIAGETFNLVDLGPGEGIKTEILITEFLRHAFEFSYKPIDISHQYLKDLIIKLKKKFPGLPSTGIHADFFEGLKWLCANSKLRNVVLFLGSSIGNFNPVCTHEFLANIHESLQHGDFVLIGFDLCKDIDILMRAYNDSDGITRDFNFNILSRLNRELNANFDLNKFHHYPVYNVYKNAMDSYLISREAQEIHIGDINQSFILDFMEPIHIESSYKYKLQQIHALANKNGFKVIDDFIDDRNYFLNSFWCVEK